MTVVSAIGDKTTTRELNADSGGFSNMILVSEGLAVYSASIQATELLLEFLGHPTPTSGFSKWILDLWL